MNQFDDLKIEDRFLNLNSAMRREANDPNVRSQVLEC